MEFVQHFLTQLLVYVNMELKIVLYINDRPYCENCQSTVFEVYYSLNKCKCQDCKTEYMLEEKNYKKKNLINHQR